MDRKTITFVKSTHLYESYYDYWKLVELCGFPTIYENELDITRPGIYIVTPMNGNFIGHMAGDVGQYQETGEVTGGELIRRQVAGLRRQAHIIIWNLERPGGSGSVGEYGRQCHKWITTRIADEVWVSDPALADETQTRYVVLGSHPGLGELSDAMNYDFCYMSMLNGRRETIYKYLADYNIGPNCWPPERDDVLRRSKFALNIHQDDWPFCEPLKFALFAAYGLPVISETLANAGIYSGDIIMAGYHDIVSKIKVALDDDYDQWLVRGMSLHKKLCYDMQFGDMVRQAVEDGAGKGWR